MAESTTPSSGGVFISYRREDASGMAGRLYDRLAARFGEDQVFMDVDRIGLGVDFAEVISQAVSTCDVLIAVIGQRWLTAVDEDNKRRLDDPDDFVRLEIEAALARDIRVIPILVEGAPMPRSRQLPDSLAKLARRNAHSVRHESFHQDASQLLTEIELVFRSPTIPPHDQPQQGATGQDPRTIDSGLWEAIFKKPPDEQDHPAAPPRVIPRVLLDRYEVGRLLGAGGMAEVYEGRDRLLARQVAIKVLLDELAQDSAFLIRFKREAQAAASLIHPNIAMVYDTGVQDGTNFIVMEYVEGQTLRDVIGNEGPLMPERAGGIAADVCRALAAGHARGLIHRDVKPGNVMLTPGGGFNVKVMDFGIAMASGTAQYISPEQAQGQTVDFRSDLYSLGCVLYEMLTGRVPFSGESPVAIAYRHVREDPVPPRQLNPDVSPALEAVVLKAMAKNPDERYQTAVEMQNAMGGFVAK
jgi:hypothetical protein